MIERYKFIEELFTGGAPHDQGLSLNINSNSALRIIRMLSGTCSLKDEFFDGSVKIRTNYLDIPCVRQSKISKKAFKSNFPEEVTFDDLAGYFKDLKQNDEFYKLVEAELISCLSARLRNKYLEAFFFLYRLLEGISYSIPLMYISKSRSFMKSFKALQGAMPTSEKEGELLFFKNFIDEQWYEKSFYNIGLDIDISSVEVEEMHELYYDTYKRFLPNGDALVADEEDELLSIRFPYFRGFLVNLRNRYFHFLQGSWQRNVETGEILFPDLFFKPIIDPGINWIATCIFEIVMFDIVNNGRRAT